MYIFPCNLFQSSREEKNQSSSMSFPLWSLDVSVNIHPTNVRASSCLSFSFNVSISTETEFSASPSYSFQSKSVSPPPLADYHSVSHLSPEITALYHCTLRFQKELLTLMQFRTSSIFLTEPARLVRIKAWSAHKVN